MAALLALAACSRDAAAQEIKLTGPLRGCPAIRVRYARPATAEWAYWLSTGASFTRDPARRTWSPVAGAGAELTLEIARYLGFPAILPHRPLTDALRGALYERGWFAGVRVGQWAHAAANGSELLTEGGALIQADGTNVARSLGGIALRLGAGYGAFADPRTPHAAATLTYGYHEVPARHAYNVGCDPPRIHNPFAETTFGRLFVTHRRALGTGEAWQITFGVELTPSLLIRPLGWLAGRWND